MRWCWVPCLGLALVATSQRLALGQGGNFGTTTNTTFGTRTFGQGVQGSAALRAGSGATTQGGGQFGTTTGTANLQAPGQGMESFRAGQQSNAFVGRAAADMQGFFETLGAGQQSFREQLGLNRDRDASRIQNERPPIRITLSVAFQYPRVASPQMAGQLESRLENTFKKLPTFVQPSPLRPSPAPRVQVSGRTVTLRGTVTTAHQRALAEQLARLEPGVSEVQNELVVAEPLPGAPTP